MAGMDVTRSESLEGKVHQTSLDAPRETESTHQIGMADHSDQQLSTREMVRAHTYPLLAAISTISLLTITVLLISQAVKNHRYNRCIDAQMRVAVNPQGASSPGKLNYLKAVEHCEVALAAAAAAWRLTHEPCLITMRTFPARAERSMAQTRC